MQEQEKAEKREHIFSKVGQMIKSQKRKHVVIRGINGITKGDICRQCALASVSQHEDDTSNIRKASWAGW